MKICWICEQHENPYAHLGFLFEATDDNPQGFVTIGYLGKNKSDDVHYECSKMEL